MPMHVIAHVGLNHACTLYEKMHWKLTLRKKILATLGTCVSITPGFQSNANYLPPHPPFHLWQFFIYFALQSVNV